MRIGVVVVALSILPGCATLDPAYYTRPDSPGYQEQVFWGLCEVCGREFTFSGHQWDNFSTITCPYDGHEQDLRMAHNRYNYAVQQLQAQRQAQTQAMVMRELFLYPSRVSRAQSNYINCTNQCWAQARLAGHSSFGPPLECATLCMNQ